MSALVLRKTGVEQYDIIKQDERLRCGQLRRDTIGYLRLGEHNNISFASADSPQYYGIGEHGDYPGKAVFIRGRSEEEDSLPLYVSLIHQPDFEKAVLEFNKFYSNNKNLDMEDVIWE